MATADPAKRGKPCKAASVPMLVWDREQRFPILIRAARLRCPGEVRWLTVARARRAEAYYALLLDRVGAMVKAGKSLDDIKNEVKMPEYASWGSQERFPTNVDAAYRAVTGK